MFDFYYSEYLYALILLPVCLIASLLSYLYRRREWIRFAPKHEMRALLMPDRVGVKRIIKDILLIAAVGFILFALARPQTPGNIAKAEEERGIEVMLCIDVSNSMLSPDVAPSRISFTRRILDKLLDGRGSDKVGIVVFAQDAYVQLPITTDLKTAKEFLQNVSPDMLSSQGTDIAEAINLSSTAFSDRKDIGKAIIVITDGESHEGGAEEAAQRAKDAGIRVSVIGIGTEGGGIIPFEQGYLKDEHGQPVTTKLNREMCEALARAGGGIYAQSSSTNEIVKAIESELKTLPRARIGTSNRAGYIEHYAPWIAVAGILLFLELFIMQRRNRLWAKLNIFGNEHRK